MVATEPLANTDTSFVDRSRWETVRFGDVVRNANENERDPEAAGIERYVGLEHIDPESLHIERWGLVSDGTSFTRRFREGQVLFGKRRAYQRKVAVAEWDGICSGDILVFEPKVDRLLPELLPFIVQSDGFFDHALGTSAGSLSPRTRWKDLAAYEFALPPRDEQRRIAELLWAVERSVEATSKTFTAGNTLRRSYFGGLMLSGRTFKESAIGSIPEHWELVPLGELLLLCQYGLSVAGGSTGNAALLRMTNIDDGQVTDTDLQWVELPDAQIDEYRVEPGDILFNRTNSWELVGKTGLFQLSGTYVFASYLVRLRSDRDVVDPEFLNAFLGSHLGQSQILRYRTHGVSQSNVNASNLKRVLVPLPPLDEQQAYVAQVQMLANAQVMQLDHLKTVSHLKKHLLNSLLCRC